MKFLSLIFFLILLFLYRLRHNKLVFPWKLPVGQASGGGGGKLCFWAHGRTRGRKLRTAAKSLSYRHAEMLPRVDCGIDKQVTEVLSNSVVRKIWNSRREFCFPLTCFTFGNVPSQRPRAWGSNAEDIQQLNCGTQWKLPPLYLPSRGFTP